jgi:small neutral amino acid transporter SnatA (MarC family)
MEEDTSPMTIGDWMVTLFVLAIPLVNLVMYVVWAAGSSGNVNRRTFCQATLTWFAILLGFGLLVSFLGSI